MKNLFMFILLFLYSNCYSQGLDFLPKGLGLELGVGYNQLEFQKFLTAGPFSRNEFKLTPTFRLSWEKEIISNLSLMPFMGYSIIGGKSDKYEDGYEEEYSFKTLCFGLFTSYKFYNISLSIGSKYNRFLDLTQRVYTNIASDYADAPREWKEYDIGWLFKKWSLDIGGRISYSFNYFTVALEGWFSVTELINKEFDKDINANSKRFQLLIGYRL